MSKKVELSALTRAERAVIFTGIASFINAMVPWWFRVYVARKHNWFTFNAGLNGWGTAVAAAGALGALLVLARAWIWPHPAPRLDGLLYTILGVVSLIATLVLVGDRGATWLGLYVGVVLASAMTVAGLMRRTERSHGWT
ncbi:MAG: hypothetical protein ABR552_04035 [Actinomycetota bacterium]